MSVFLDKKVYSVYLIGTGLIGSELLRQIYEQDAVLKERYYSHINVVGILNAEGSCFDPDGIDLKNWEAALTDAPFPLEKMERKIRDDGFEHPVVVDCTASEHVAKEYNSFMNGGAAVVTPNKKALSGPYQEFIELIAQKEFGQHFFYETNVGAGLPIIEPLRNMIMTGDTILSIEGVFSGTLSYIFNSFVGDKTFSEVVKTAQAQGYTEPDPRDDLNGMDVARKILILAREAGVPLELSDVYVENLIPESCRSCESVDEFFVALAQEDTLFEARKKRADDNWTKLRYVASLQEGVAKVSLVEVNAQHPFYALSGSDNIVMIRSERYNDMPLVIKGPGAGAAVTAAGVFADIIRSC